MTGNLATRRTEAATDVGLSRHVTEARTRLEPPSVSVPAPRSADGVAAPVVLRTDTRDPSPELVTELDELGKAVAAVESAGEEDDTHRVLCRIAELVTGGVPDAGWSATEEIDVEVLRATSDAARELHERTTKLVERLDTEDLPGPAAALGGLSTTLQVVVVVADLELFERARR
ncbi:hypothetical protein [Actinomycetospora termitidis]|uniref:Uncharacterized protein n=1 Tax=Actinomycetospora termitidis TaxID=3053470 RepID=A0ABT7M4Y1_9PSEU|nr:hypothetical protein [Actinomycetospora sp. Odt1-22]MDL5155739.1 hypothetical protein [Actinomycetospora sp. Odt1-22]